MSARILQGSVFDMLPTIEPGSVDVAITSPPYYQLRSYLPKGHPLKAKEFGSEATVAEFVSNLVLTFRLVRDALADHGTCWVNLGSTYASSGMNPSPSPLPPRVLSCGTDGKGLRDSQAAGRACPGSDGESQDETPSRHAGIARNALFVSQGEPQTSPKGRDSERPDCAQATAAASPLDAPVSTTPALSSHGLVASCPSDAASASRKARRTSLRSSPQSEHSSACTDGTSPTLQPLAARIAGTASFSSACHRSDCRGLGNCGLCWCSLAIPPLQFKAGDIIDTPQLVKFALQADGWICRSVIVWHKPAPMPASLSGWAWRRCRVKTKDGTMRAKNGDAHRPRLPVSGDGSPRNGVGDFASWQDCPGCPKCEPHGGYVLRRGSWRPTSSWEPILMLAKSPGYFCDGESVKQPSAAATVSRNEYSRIIDDPDEQFAVKHDHETTADEANLRDVWAGPALEDLPKEELIGLIQSWDGGDLQDIWKIASEPLRERHYAAFPSALVLNCLRAGTSLKGYCPGCGKPWCRVIETKFYGDCRAGRRGDDAEEGKNEWRGTAGVENYESPKTLDWRPSCSCPPASPRPGLVLDPFCGSGRTGITATRLGLDFVGVELNPSYVEMGRRLLTEDSPLFNQAAP